MLRSAAAQIRGLAVNHSSNPGPIWADVAGRLVRVATVVATAPIALTREAIDDAIWRFKVLVSDVRETTSQLGTAWKGAQQSHETNITTTTVLRNDCQAKVPVPSSGHPIVRAAKYVVLVGGLIYVGYKVYRHLCHPSAPWRNTASRILSASARSPPLRVETLRSQFTDMPVDITPFKQPGHSHPASANLRSTASLVACRFATVTGTNAYFYQRSRADERNGRAGSRTHYWSRDLEVGSQEFNPPANPLIVMIDVEYYIDMPYFLAHNFHPVLVYTLQPEQAAREGKDYRFTFNTDQTVTYTVSGGESFTHMVWNYTTDSLTATAYFLGLPYRQNTYMVEHKKMGPDRQMVLLAPLTSHDWKTAWLYAITLQYKPLNRLLPCFDGFARLDVVSPDGCMRSTARCGDYACATIPVATDNAIASVARTNTMALTMPQVWSFISSSDDKECTKEPATVLTEFHRKLAGDKPPVMFAPQQGITRYQFEPKSFDPEAHSPMSSFMQPLMLGTYVPDRTPANDRVGVNQRLTSIKSSVEMTPFLVHTMDEFVEQFLPRAHFMHPTDDEELYARQARPPQRHILETAAPMPFGQRILKVFAKAEPYPEPKPERLISTINGVDKASYSKYIYPFSDYLKSMPWYAFGHTPREIAERVAQLCTHASLIVLTDLSKFDGRLSKVLRVLEQIVLLRAYHPQHHQEILDLHRSQFNLPAVTSFGVRYQSGTARASGSPETAAFNSLANAFMAFLCLRRTRVRGAFLAPSEAWAALGLYGGDDGLTPDVDMDVYTTSCQMVGQQLTAATIVRGSPGIKFLAREFSPQVWFGSPQSMCDLPRQIPKFHTTTLMPESITPTQKLIEKGRAFYLTDKNTPIMGPLTCRIILLAHLPNVEMPTLPGKPIWFSDVPTIDQYPNEPGPWMNERCQQLLPGFDHKAFAAWVEKCTTLDDLLRAPICHEPPALVNRNPLPVVAGDQILAGAAGKARDNTPETPPLKPPPSRFSGVPGALRINRSTAISRGAPSAPQPHPASERWRG
jgi:hypothetical protein